MLFCYRKKILVIDVKMYCDFKIIALSVLSTIAVILFFYSYTLMEVYKLNLISNFHPVGRQSLPFLIRFDLIRFRFMVYFDLFILALSSGKM